MHLIVIACTVIVVIATRCPVSHCRMTKKYRTLHNHHYYVLMSQFNLHTLQISFANFCKLSVWSTSINPAQSYTWLSLCACACAKCMLKLCMVKYNDALSLRAMKQKFDLKNNFLSKNVHWIPRDKNILPWTIFTWKYPTVNFFTHYGRSCLISI